MGAIGNAVYGVEGDSLMVALAFGGLSLLVIVVGAWIGRRDTPEKYLKRLERAREKERKRWQKAA